MKFVCVRVAGSPKAAFPSRQRNRGRHLGGDSRFDSRFLATSKDLFAVCVVPRQLFGANLLDTVLRELALTVVALAVGTGALSRRVWSA